MITWFQRVFGKHFRWVLMGFLFVLLISFIAVIGVPKLNTGGPTAQKRMFYDTDLNDQIQLNDQVKAASLTLQFQGFIEPTDAQAQNTVFARLTLLHLADEWKLPQPSQKQIDDYVRSLPMFANPTTGAFDNDRYTHFHDNLQAAPQSESDFIANLLVENCRIDRVRRILSGPGYALPYLANFIVTSMHAKYDVDVATLDYKNFEPKIVEDDTVLRQLYAKSPQHFQLPTKVDLSYVKFTAPPSTVEPTAAQLGDYLTAHAADFPGVKPDALGDKAAAVTAAWRKEQVQQQAGQAGIKFAQEFVASGIHIGTPEFTDFVQKHNLTLQTLPELTEGKDAPADSPIPNDVLKSDAFSLDAQHPLSFPPLPLPDGAVILFLNHSTPGAIPSFEQARADVLKVYSDQEKFRQFTARGEEVRGNITKAMAAGKTFGEAAKAEGLEVKNYPGLTNDALAKEAVAQNGEPAKTPDLKDTASQPLAGLSKDFIYALINPTKSGLPMLSTLRPGDVSPMTPLTDYGVIFHVVTREMPTLGDDSPDVQKSLKNMADMEAGISSAAVLQSIVTPVVTAFAKDNPKQP